MNADQLRAPIGSSGDVLKSRSLSDPPTTKSPQSCSEPTTFKEEMQAHPTVGQEG